MSIKSVEADPTSFDLDARSVIWKGWTKPMNTGQNSRFAETFMYRKSSRKQLQSRANTEGAAARGFNTGGPDVVGRRSARHDIDGVAGVHQANRPLDADTWCMDKERLAADPPQFRKGGGRSVAAAVEG